MERTEKKNKIKILRIEKGLSQDELSKKVHVTQSAVSSWEVGNSYPDMQTAIELADFFNVSIDYLVGRVDEKNLTNYANNVRNNHFVQGYGSVIVGNEEATKEAYEFIRVYKMLGVKERLKLMNIIYELELQNNK